MNKTTALNNLFWPVLILAVLTLVALTTRPFTPIDETRYLSVAWEMWQHNDYLVMFKNGEPYSHKPPLLFWLYNLGWLVFGVNEWWPRLVSPLFSLGGLVLTLSIARRLWPQDAKAGKNTVWILASSLLWMIFSTSAMFDVMLAFFVLVGMRGLLIAANESMRRGFAWLALAIGLGILAKGPVVLLQVLPAALLVFWWKPGLNWKHWYGGMLLAVLGGAAIALMWAIPAAIRGGEEYRHAIFWGQTANRMVDSFAHKRPIWWYVPLLPVLLFPWLVWPELWKKLTAMKRAGLDFGSRFCLAWMIPVFVAFSFISGKQIHYLIPLFPAFALLAGRALSGTEDVRLWLPASLMLVAGAAMTYFAFAKLPGDAAMWTEFPWWPGIALGLLALAAGRFGRRKAAWLPSLALLGAGFFGLFQIYLSPAGHESYDVHPMAQEIKKLQDRGVLVAHAGNYHAQYQFAGRLTQPLVMLDAKSANAWLKQQPQGAVVTYTRRGMEPKEFLFSQPYRGETAVLMSAAQVNAMGGLSGKKAGRIIPEAEAE